MSSVSPIGLPHRTAARGIREAFSDFAAASPSRFAILVFALLVLVWTTLLSLPVSSADGTRTPLADALFTAVSVVCVTGLATVDMASHWSGFGEVVIYIGVQIGGIGVLTLASTLGLIISRHLGLRAKLIAAGDTNPLRAHRGPVAEGQAVRLGDVGELLVTIAISLVVIEALATIVLFPTMLAHGFTVAEAARDSVYYSAMAFTNTGFTPNGNGLLPFSHDYLFLTTIAVTVMLGAIGFPVIYALARVIRHPGQRRRLISLHVKLTVVTYLLLFVLGAGLYLPLEYDNPETFGHDGAGDTVFQAFFLSAMARSGGFATIDPAQLHGSSRLVTDMLMFIGGGSASTGGGIKVTTLAVLFLAAVAEAKGVESMEAFRRRIPGDVLRVAVSVVLWGATVVAAATVSVLAITGDSLDHVLFDVISAFATCGLSAGLTQGAPHAAVYVLAATMFVGRLGSITLAAALAQSQHRRLYAHPEERPIVG
ncbi:TrkH family potassium uptake protein [Gryllotalpicola ginsengisoli]|uniref:TrkH family potassium uptake protein n=1 Tax=Gryllotalpicola ginsengisoli TaxID=444608 RepID=UPI0003B5CEA6|nr:potassium transporter TrkG [Gryllotalpicola ginsengisoli]